MATEAHALLGKVDFRFVADAEGGQWTRGYLPLHGKPPFTGATPWDEKSLPVERSGVTIATGFDIGQWSIGELARLPISESLRSRLRPYCAPLTGRSAALKLHHSGGLTITKPEADELDAAVRVKVLSQFVAAYDDERKRVGGKHPFQHLPKDICTAMYSFAYQYGAGWGPAKVGTAEFAQAFWSHITKQDWSKAIAVLRSYTEHRRRRQHEADLIERGVKELPPLAGQPLL